MFDVAVNFPMNDEARGLEDLAILAVGRNTNFSGTDFETRDLGWKCETKSEAQRIAAKLRAIGLQPHITRRDEP